MKKLDISYLILGCSILFTIFVIGRGFLLNYYSFGNQSVSSRRIEANNEFDKSKYIRANISDEELHEKMREEKIEKAVDKNKKRANFVALSEKAHLKLDSFPPESRAVVYNDIDAINKDMQARLNYNKSDEAAQSEILETYEDRMLIVFKKYNLID